METCFNYTDSDTCYVSSDERKWINKIRKLAAEKSEEVRIICQPENNDGCIYATVPTKWLKIHPPKQISDEKRAILSERAKKNFVFGSKPAEESRKIDAISSSSVTDG